MRRELNEALPNQGHFFNDGLPGKRFTPAGPDHAQIAAVNGVADYMDAVADHHGLRRQAGRNARQAYEVCFARTKLPCSSRCSISSCSTRKCGSSAGRARWTARRRSHSR